MNRLYEQLQISVDFSLKESDYNGILYDLISSKGTGNEATGEYLVAAWDFLRHNTYSEYICLTMCAIHRAKYLTKKYNLDTEEDYLSLLSSFGGEYHLPKPGIFTIILPNTESGHALYEFADSCTPKELCTLVHNVLLDYCQLSGEPYFIQAASEAYLHELAGIYASEGLTPRVKDTIDTNISYGHLPGWEQETEFFTSDILAYISSLVGPVNSDLS